MSAYNHQVGDGRVVALRAIRTERTLACAMPEPSLASASTGELRGERLTLVAADGTRYLDAVSGTFNLPLGYDHPEVVARVQAQVRQITHVSSHFGGSLVARLRDKLTAHAPAGIDAAWIRDVTGSTAVECAVKIAQKYTGKTDVMSLFLSHHGQTHYTTAISGNAFRRSNQPDAVSPHSVKVPGPYCHRCFYGAEYPSCALMCASRIQDFIDYASSGRVAAVIVEPIQGNGGNIVPPPGYFAELRKVCDRNGMLLIVDEVQTGIGRTGRMYACETLGIEPDIMVLAKGLGGIGVPVGAVLMRSEYSVLERHEHSFTSGANLVALAAADATLDVVGADPFLAEVRRKGQLLGQGLKRIGRRSSLVSDVRGVGFMWGLEMTSPDLAMRVIEVALEHRLILRGSRYGRGNVVKVRPALIANEDELMEIIDRLERTIQTVEGEL